MTADYRELKERSKAVWAMGDYRPLARVLEPVSIELVNACGISEDQEVLDVAAGTGNCALAAAHRGARVVAADFSPTLLEMGRERTRAAGLRIQWDEADVEELPYEDERFDCVTSVFGAMFAPRQEVVASELFRVVRGGAVVGMANWTPTSFTAGLMDIGARHSPPPDGAPSPLEWGSEDAVSSLFSGHVSSIDFQLRTLQFEFESWEAMRCVLEVHGIAQVAKKTLPSDQYESMFRDMEGLVAECNEGTGETILIHNEYLQVVARK